MANRILLDRASLRGTRNRFAANKSRLAPLRGLPHPCGRRDFL